MIFYISVILYLLYQLYKRPTKISFMLLCLCALSAVAYMGIPLLFIDPVPSIFSLVAAIIVFYLIFLSWREYKDAKRNYLKKRRIQREHAGENRSDEDEHQRIVIEDRKTSKEKVIYLKRNEKNVPHGTMEIENSDEDKNE